MGIVLNPILEKILREGLLDLRVFHVILKVLSQNDSSLIDGSQFGDMLPYRWAMEEDMNHIPIRRHFI